MRDPAAIFQTPTPTVWRRRQPNDLAFTATLLAFVVLVSLGPLTFPPYYEDESWTYLPVFEALRGNGFSWAAFGEGRALLAVFPAMVIGIVALPMEPEVAVRVASAVWGLLALIAAFALGRRVAPSAAWLPPALMVATPYVFTALRYGRTDGAALALAMGAVASAAYNRSLLAGVLSGLAVSTYPTFVWVAATCLWFAWRSGAGNVWRYAIGASLGIAPQVCWMVLHWTEIDSVIQRFAVSSSVGSLRSQGLLASMADEPRRYVDYAIPMAWWLRVVHIGAYVVLPMLGMRAGPGLRTSLILMLTAPPVLGLALLSQTKNPYYVYGVLPFVAVAAGCAVDSLSARHRRLIAVLAGLAVAMSLTSTGISTLTNRRDVTTRDMTAALADRLPHGALVIAPNLYAGLIRRRPDIRFFNYHALSNRPGWSLPTCSEMSSRIRALAESDPRPSSAGPTPEEAYLVSQTEWPLLNYLRQIFVGSTENDARCLLASDAGPLVRVRVCRGGTTPCGEALVARMTIRP